MHILLFCLLFSSVVGSWLNPWSYSWHYGNRDSPREPSTSVDRKTSYWPFNWIHGGANVDEEMRPESQPIVGEDSFDGSFDSGSTSSKDSLSFDDFEGKDNRNLEESALSGELVLIKSTDVLNDANES
jgi:hypothetical protein